MTNGPITYGFGNLSNNGYIVLYGFGQSFRPIVQLNFALEIEQLLEFSLER